MFRCVIVVLSVLVVSSANAEQPAKQYFGAVEAGSQQSAEAFGSYAKGCVSGAVQLPETGPRWQAMRLSRNRNWGHPDAISFIERLSQTAVDEGWAGLYIGDISQPRGGPMLSGHASHQMGVDLDIWMLPADRIDLSSSERENISSKSVVSKDLRSTNSRWTPAHHAIIMAALKDEATARIFVSGAIKMKMCEDASADDKPYLRKLRPWWGHTYHFHVRLNCPAGSPNCVEQAPPPAGDGCEDAVWWVTDALLPPDPDAPAPKPKPELVMDDLPEQCVGVLKSE